MKIFYAIFLVVFLASCTTTTVENNTDEITNNTTVETEVNENDEMDEDTMNSEDDAEDDMTEMDEETANTEEPEDEMEDTDAMDSDLEVEVSADIDADVEMLEETAENEVMTLDAAYSNPAGPVDMTISYSVDENNVITSMDVNATTYDVSGFNTEAQSLIGQDISAAEDFYVAGGSLTSEAFTTAMKNR